MCFEDFVRWWWWGKGWGTGAGGSSSDSAKLEADPTPAVARRGAGDIPNLASNVGLLYQSLFDHLTFFVI